MTINERMRLVRQEAGDNFTRCGERIGISRSAVSMIESGANKPSNQTIEIFCREYGINREWLENGVGEMKKPPLDEVAQLLSDVLDKGNDDPLYSWFLSVIKTYQKLDVKDRAIVMRFIEETINAQMLNKAK